MEKNQLYSFRISPLQPAASHHRDEMEKWKIPQNPLLSFQWEHSVHKLSRQKRREVFFFFFFWELIWVWGWNNDCFFFFLCFWVLNEKIVFWVLIWELGDGIERREVYFFGEFIWIFFFFFFFVFSGFWELSGSEGEGEGEWEGEKSQMEKEERWEEKNNNNNNDMHSYNCA